jgi:cytochrome c5
MKTKIMVVTVLAVVLYSCASKTVAVKPLPINETKAVVSTEKLTEGKNLYENSCNRCHELYPATAFSKEDWKPIFIKMQPKAHLDDTQMASISDYITSQL